MSILTINKDNFSEEVLNSDKPVLVDFWADWCGPCRLLSPIVDEVADEATFVKVGKVNVDEQQDLARQFGIMSIPTLVFFKNGEVIRQTSGVQTKDSIVRMIEM